MPLKIYLPDGNESSWENEMSKVSNADRKRVGSQPDTTLWTDQNIKPAQMSIDEKVAQIFPNLDEQFDHQQERGKQVYPWLPHEVPSAPEAVVQAPKHYAKGGIETIDHIRAKLSAEEFCGYCRGNVMKYIDRYSEKGGLDDLKKLMVYAGWLVDAYEKRLTFPHKVVG